MVISLLVFGFSLLILDQLSLVLINQKTKTSNQSTITKN